MVKCVSRCTIKCNFVSPPYSLIQPHFLISFPYKLVQLFCISKESTMKNIELNPSKLCPYYHLPIWKNLPQQPWTSYHWSICMVLPKWILLELLRSPPHASLLDYPDKPSVSAIQWTPMRILLSVRVIRFCNSNAELQNSGCLVLLNGTGRWSSLISVPPQCSSILFPQRTQWSSGCFSFQLVCSASDPGPISSKAGKWINGTGFWDSCNW